jgi:DNA adenine methylase
VVGPAQAPQLHPESGSTPRPFLKWAGGKKQLLGRLADLLPPDFDRYAEPFVGSAALFFYLRRTRGKFRSHLSDRNSELANCYAMVRDRVEQLIPLLRTFQNQHSKMHYYEVRRLRADDLDELHRAARLIYLNHTCFNGLYRVNSQGDFNVPIGSYVRPRICDEETLRAASAALKGCKISHRDFGATVDRVRRGDFVYFDPPYHPVSRTSSFTSYAVGVDARASFGIEEQERLAATFAALDLKGCRVMLSNSDCALMRRLYRRYQVRTVQARRAINSNGAGRGMIREIVVTNY